MFGNLVAWRSVRDVELPYQIFSLKRGLGSIGFSPRKACVNMEGQMKGHSTFFAGCTKKDLTA